MEQTLHCGWGLRGPTPPVTRSDVSIMLHVIAMHYLQDSYGCNLVCQVAGSKQWTLFPPSDSAHLSPTRVPYEESSVYSLVNMVSLEHNYQHILDKVSQHQRKYLYLISFCS